MEETALASNDVTSQCDAVDTAERRALVRWPCEKVGSCHRTFASQDWQPAVVRDISVGGLGITVSRRMEVGVILSVEIEATSSAPGRKVMARVQHVRQTDDGAWFLGCKFPSQLDEDEVREMM